MYSKGNSFPNKKKKVNCTKWIFLEETLVLIWLVVLVALLDREVVFGYKELVLLKVKALLSY